MARPTSIISSLARQVWARARCSSTFCDFSSWVARVAATEQTAAPPQSRRHDGLSSPSAAVSQAVNPGPPTAGPVVKAAARVPPKIVTLSSRRLRGVATASQRSTSCRLRAVRAISSAFGSVLTAPCS